MARCQAPQQGAAARSRKMRIRAIAFKVAAPGSQRNWRCSLGEGTDGA